MQDYSNKSITSDKHGNKLESEDITKFNESVEDLSGVNSSEEFSDFKYTQDKVNFLKLKNYNGGNAGSLSSISKPPENKAENYQNVLMSLKESFYNSVVDNDKLTQKKLLETPDKIVGTIKIFQDANEKLSNALTKPLGSPKSLNIGLMSNNTQWLDYVSEFNIGNGFNMELDENNDIMLYQDNNEPIYIDRLIDQQVNPSINSDDLIPTLGDPKEMYNTMDSVGDSPLVERITESLKIKPVKEGDNDVMYSIEDNGKIENMLVNYDHTNMLNQKSKMQSLWPQAQQMAVSVLNGLDYEKPDSWSPLENKLISIMSEYRKYEPKVNLVEDYQKNGGEKWGNYIGAEVNYSQKNSPLVDFQRDLLGWSFNNGYHNQSVLPYVKQDASVKQGDSNEGLKNAGKEVKEEKNDSDFNELEFI
tara:strand:- start:229 stop:1482 length:1254 start_codon:yes stop_codon:yes gene_type:complete